VPFAIELMFSESLVGCCGLCVQFSCGYFFADMAMVVAFYPILGGYEFVSLSYLNFIHVTYFSEKEY